MSNVEYITLIGKHSKKEIVIDLKAVLDISQVFLHDSPKEMREIGMVTRIIHLNDTLKDALVAELGATDKIIDNLCIDDVTKRGLDESD
jgi:hypothetical protein